MVHADLLETVIKGNDITGSSRCQAGKHGEGFPEDTIDLRAQSVGRAVVPQFPNPFMDIHDVVITHHNIVRRSLNSGEATVANNVLSEGGNAVFTDMVCPAGKMRSIESAGPDTPRL